MLRGWDWEVRVDGWGGDEIKDVLAHQYSSELVGHMSGGVMCGKKSICDVISVGFGRSIVGEDAGCAGFR